MRKLKMAVHVLLFVVAIAFFYIGLGIGLQHNPNLGTILWIVAAGIAVANLLWIVRSRDGRGDSTENSA